MHTKVSRHPAHTRRERAGVQHRLPCCTSSVGSGITFTMWEAVGTLPKFKFPKGSQEASCQLSKDSSLRLGLLTFSFQF